MNLKTTFCAITLGLSAFVSKAQQPDVAGPSRPNILFIPVDDLRPELGVYGNKVIKTPNLDALANKGALFMSTYCQQAVCNPSRASLLTGLRPDETKVWDLETDFRAALPKAVTLPQFFKEHGYTALAIGKTFHNTIADTISWDYRFHLPGFPFDADATYAGEENLAILNKKIAVMKANGKKPDALGVYYTKANSEESADVSDDAYYDGAQTTKAIGLLKSLSKSTKPFFLSVGFYKPHLPFNAPKKYWDLYDENTLPIAPNPFPPKGSPAYAVHGDQELRWYMDHTDLPLPQEKPLDAASQRKLVHGYYACVSYIDAQVGRLMHTLDSLGLAKNTIIVLWGDHGWKLGEHNAWAKQTNYEIDTHVPMIVAGPGVQATGAKITALTEFVDIYPSLLEMTGFKVPSNLEGKSFVPLLKEPKQEWKKAAFSQFLLGRFGKIARIPGEVMGYTVRTDKYRYVEWYQWDKTNNTATTLLSKELFDEKADPQENVNLAGNKKYNTLMKSLNEQLRTNFKQVRAN